LNTDSSVPNCPSPAYKQQQQQQQQKINKQTVEQTKEVIIFFRKTITPQRAIKSGSKKSRHLVLIKRIYAKSILLAKPSAQEIYIEHYCYNSTTLILNVVNTVVFQL